MFSEEEDLVPVSLKHRVYLAAHDGLPLTIYSLLSDLGEQANDVLNELFVDEEDQRCTPLMIAAKRGHEKVIKALLSQFKPNLEVEGTLKLENFVIEGASALWIAAGAGFLNVVKVLVQAGADVNHATQPSQSTPLRAACFDGRLDIVQYLVEHNADIHRGNKFGNTCLMIAAYKGHNHIVKFLLEKGADPNTKANCGASALHFAVECGHVDIVKDLLSYGAVFNKNNYGMTPLLTAAERTRSDVVEYFLTLAEFTKLEKVEALELLGASFANDRDSQCIDKAYYYLHAAMELRFSDPSDPLLKVPYPPVAAYDNWRETSNLKELEDIKQNANAIYMESLTIRERILGKHNPEVTHPIIFRGAVYADCANFDRCIQLWLHALALRGFNNLSIAKDLLRFAQVFSQMIHIGIALEVEPIKAVLEAAITELQRNRQALSSPPVLCEKGHLSEELETNMKTALYILVIVTHLISSDKISEPDKHSFYVLVYKLNKLNVTTINGETLLHLAVNFRTPVDDFHTNNVCKFPNAYVAKLLMQCGADVDAMDNKRNTPLHIIVSYQKPVSDFITLHSIIIDLIKYGAHIDPVNCKGETPYEAASTGVAEIILKTQSKRPTTLKCIAAKVVKSFDLTYQGRVPKTLESFIELHGSGIKQG